MYQPIASTPLQSVDQVNASCFRSRSSNSSVRNISPIQYVRWNSAMIILSGSLQSNETYQFLVTMVSRRNASRQATGYLLVKVEDTKPQMIAVA